MELSLFFLKGGGYESLDLFPEKLNLYVCRHHHQPSSDEQGAETAHQLSSAMSSSTDGGYHTGPSVSNYFNSTGQIGREKVGQTESAAKKMFKLKRM